MKASEIIKFLETVVEKHGDVTVDLNDEHGRYENIVGMKVQSWVDNKDRSHKVVTFIHDGSYDSEDSYVIDKSNKK